MNYKMPRKFFLIMWSFSKSEAILNFPVNLNFFYKSALLQAVNVSMLSHNKESIQFNQSILLSWLKVFFTFTIFLFFIFKPLPRHEFWMDQKRATLIWKVLISVFFTMFLCVSMTTTLGKLFKGKVVQIWNKNFCQIQSKYLCNNISFLALLHMCFRYIYRTRTFPFFLAICSNRKIVKSDFDNPGESRATLKRRNNPDWILLIKWHVCPFSPSWWK